MSFVSQPVPRGVFYSAILGLGPDRTLLAANRALWSGVALIMLIWVVMLYVWRERRVRLYPASMWKLGLASIAGLGLAIGGWATLKHSAAWLQADPLPVQLLVVDAPSDGLASRYVYGEFAPPPNRPLLDWSALKVLAVAAKVSLTPNNSQMRGETTLTLHYEGKGALEEVPLLLNSGLQVERVIELETEKEVAFARTGLELTLYPVLPLESGAPWVVKVFYQGRYKTPRVAYRDLDVCLHQVVEAKSYLGQDVAFLMRDGDWYPWPLSHSVRREAVGRLTVRLPAGRQTFHTGRETPAGELVWEGRWPAPLVASYPSDKLQRLAVAGGQAFLADLGDTVAQEEAFDYAAAYTGLSQWLEETTPTVTMVQVPLILQPVAASTSSGRDILFIPEGTAFVNRQRDGWTGARVEGDAVDRRRARSREAMAAWWSARLDFASPHYVTACPFTNTDCMADASCTLQVLPRDLFLDLLSSVSAGAWLGTTGQAVDRVNEATLLNRVLGQEPSTFESVVEMEQTWTLTHEAERELIRHGILPALAIPYDMIDLTPASLDLVEAWVRLGDEALGRILHDWLNAHNGGYADRYDLLQRLR